jgi:hypothetical protein
MPEALRGLLEALRIAASEREGCPFDKAQEGTKYWPDCNVVGAGCRVVFAGQDTGGCWVRYWMEQADNRIRGGGI